MFSKVKLKRTKEKSLFTILRYDMRLEFLLMVKMLNLTTQVTSVIIVIIYVKDPYSHRQLIVLLALTLIFLVELHFEYRGNHIVNVPLSLGFAGNV